MKIAIVGAGAMGSRYGYMLHEADLLTNDNIDFLYKS